MEPAFVQRDDELGVTFEWFDPPFAPPEDEVDQAYGLCVTDESGIVLVHDGSYGWNLPGGGVEPGELPLEAFVREVMEEACARVVASTYIGCQRVTHHSDARLVRRPWHDRTTYWQVRYWARVELLPWDPQHEIVERSIVTPAAFMSALRWGNAPSAERILSNGLAAEGRYAR